MKKKEHISTVLCSTLCRKKKEEYCSRLFVYKSIHLNRCAAWSLLYCCRRSIKRIDFRLWLNTKYRHPTHYKYTYKNIQSIVFFFILAILRNAQRIYLCALHTSSYMDWEYCYYHIDVAFHSLVMFRRSLSFRFNISIMSDSCCASLITVEILMENTLNG